MVLALASLPVVFARGGGGGSGGGGGGGRIIVAIGYLPMHFLGAYLRKAQKDHKHLFGMLQVVGWVMAVIFSILLIIVLKGIGVIAGIGALVGMGAGLYGWFGKLRRNKQAEA